MSVSLGIQHLKVEKIFTNLHYNSSRRDVRSGSGKVADYMSSALTNGVCGINKDFMCAYWGDLIEPIVVDGY